MPDAPTVADVAAILEGRYPAAKAAGWDPVGLQIGDPVAPVRSAAVCHEVTEAVVTALERRHVDALVTYHPLLFRPVHRLVAGPGAGGRAFRLARAGVALLVAHTNFDVAPGGAADALAGSLGLEEVRPFGPVWGSDAVKIVVFAPASAANAVAAAMGAAGAGRIGRYEGCSFRAEGTGTFFAPEDSAPATGRRGVLNAEPEVRLEMTAPADLRDRVVAAMVAVHPYEEPAFDVYGRAGDAGFAGRIGRPPGEATLRSMARLAGQRLGGVVRMAGEPDMPIELAAAVPGSGADLIAEAAAAGADVLVTGDVSHHRVRDALDRGLAVIDPGHAATERPGIANLYAAVSEIVETTEDLGGVDPDPWREP